jgi:hypothetical protein
MPRTHVIAGKRHTWIIQCADQQDNIVMGRLAKTAVGRVPARSHIDVDTSMAETPPRALQGAETKALGGLPVCRAEPGLVALLPLSLFATSMRKP